MSGGTITPYRAELQVPRDELQSTANKDRAPMRKLSVSTRYLTIAILVLLAFAAPTFEKFLALGRYIGHTQQA